MLAPATPPTLNKAQGVNVLDVASSMLNRFDKPISTMKLQKLVFFSQAWALAFDVGTLFDEEFEAWRYGPVSRKLFNAHRGQYDIDPATAQLGDASKVSELGEVILSAVYDNYGGLSGLDLSEITHTTDSPWDQIRAAKNLGPQDASTAIISKDLIKSFYKKKFRIDAQLIAGE